MAHGAPPDGKETETGDHSYRNKRRNPDGERDEEDEAPATRPCLQLEDGANGGSSRSNIANSTTLARALRRQPAGRPGETAVAVRSEAHAPMVLSGLHELYQEENLCDVTVRVDGEDFRAHRVVLAAASDFLRFALCAN